jgi:hypothetical protein
VRIAALTPPPKDLVMRASALKTLATLALLAFGALAARAQDQAPGRFVNLKPEDVAGVPTFTSNDKVLMTYYFYWYDAPTNGHFIDPDGTSGNWKT